jgi:Family of unknown function (DUF5689)
MKIQFIKSILLIFVMSNIVSSCVDSDSYSDPKEEIRTYEFTTNKTIQDLASVFTGPTPVKYEADDIIEGYVTSSDETGNFFNTITLQSGLATATNLDGFSVSAEFKSFNKGFRPGRKVYIKLKGLYIATVDGSIKIGGLFTENGTTSVGRISQFEWQNHLFPSGTLVDESLLIKPFTVTSDINANNKVLNTLVEFNNVQFADGSLGRTLFDIDSGGLATNHNIVNANGGITRYLRVSSFSILSGAKIPSGRGTVRGVLTRFGSDYQVIIRYESDLKLTNSRTYDFRSSFTENFNGFSAATGNYDSERSYYSFKDYINFSTIGTKNWFIRDNTFLEMSAFSGAVERNKCYFLVPVDMTAASTFTFQYKLGFYSAGGTAFKIYRTADYVPGMKITDATLIDISSSFTIPSATTSSFASAGVYNIPTNVTGNGYFILEYTGTNISTGPPVTTTVQIDNIIVN